MGTLEEVAITGLFRCTREFNNVGFGRVNLARTSGTVFDHLTCYSFSRCTNGALNRVSGLLAVSGRDTRGGGDATCLARRLLLRVNRDRQFGGVVILRAQRAIDRSFTVTFCNIVFRVCSNLCCTTFEKASRGVIDFCRSTRLTCGFPVADRTATLGCVDRTVTGLNNECCVNNRSGNKGLTVFSCLFLGSRRGRRVVEICGGSNPNLPGRITRVVFAPRTGRAILGLLPRSSVIKEVLTPNNGGGVVGDRTSNNTRRGVFA